MPASGKGATAGLVLLALAGGAWIGYADARSDDVFITLGMLMGFCFLLGLAGQSRAWFLAPLVGIWVPLLDMTLPPLGLAPQRPGENFGVLSALAVTGLVLVVCYAGAYLGAALSWALRHAWPDAGKVQR